MSTLYQKILPMFEAMMPFGGKLDLENRWIKLSVMIPWDRLDSAYRSHFSELRQSQLKDCRLMMGLLVGKHLLCLSDNDIVDYLHENPYFQYFCGFDQFVSAGSGKIVHPSLLSKRRKRLGQEYFAFFEQEVLAILKESGVVKAHKLALDATVFPSNISYPNDVKVMNSAREWLCSHILVIKNALQPDQKIRTYRKVARKLYIGFQKTRKKSRQKIEKTKKAMRRYLKRNVEQAQKLFATYKGRLEQWQCVARELSSHTMKKVEQGLYVAQIILDQQTEMIQNKTNQVAERVVSFHAPEVRPIVRGKEGKKVEFGPKVHLAHVDGFAFYDRLDFENFHEGKELQVSLSKHQERFGQKPQELLADEIYAIRENRNHLKEEKIEECFRPVGKSTARTKKLKKRKRKGRNVIEGMIGNLKEHWNMDHIRYKGVAGAAIQMSLTLATHNLIRGIQKMDIA